MKSALLAFFLLCSVTPCLNGCGDAAPTQTQTPPSVSQPASSQTETPPASDDAGSQTDPQTPATSSQATGKVVVIDAGHQRRANTALEPIGPGAAETKMKVTGGTVGVATGIAEYQLNLTVSLALRDELTTRGYTVVMVRETNDVDLSNRQRADIANNAGADVFLRIHANGSTNSSASGAMTLCPTAGNPYPIGGLYPQCRALADDVLNSFVQATGAKKERVWETDTMSGINWCQVPVTILEMGYLSNPAEDTRLNSSAYQQKMVQGIANGVDRYFADSGD